ncbi:hypothetical protein AMTR_s00021p00197880 [Amborella trichopoda]|uniref:Uncharacterized protein n=1 Tax=Amborella trichopoda TaxID=13333 RepID=W1PVG6_AMBTC|nr:hypothetical protein AMTR_s00021p00197880 [Amborella trichopoda]
MVHPLQPNRGKAPMFEEIEEITGQRRNWRRRNAPDWTLKVVLKAFDTVEEAGHAQVQSMINHRRDVVNAEIYGKVFQVVDLEEEEMEEVERKFREKERMEYKEMKAIANRN